MIKMNKATRDRLNALAARLDAMSLRERVFMFLSGAALLLALLDTVWIGPLRDEMHKQAEAKTRLETEIKALREQYVQSAKLGLGASESGPGKLLAEAQSQNVRLREQIAQGINGAGGAPGVNSQAQLPALLGTLLTQQPRLSLLRLDLLNSPPPHAAGIALPGFTWQGVELLISGDYLEQMRYLKKLEQSLPNLHWGELRLRSLAQDQPLLLQVRLYLLRVDS